MRTERVTLREQMELIDFYYNKGVKYEIKRSGNSQALLVNGTAYFSAVLSSEKRKVDNMPDNQLYFVSKVKKHIERQGLCKKIKPNYKNTAEIGFFKGNESVLAGEEFVDAYSVDISKAYWRCAFNGGWITKEIYEEGLGVHKTARLASLGSFAKSIDVYVYDGREERFKGTIKPKYPHVFFNAANTIFKCMEECRKALASVDGFLFYWTDGIYVKDLVSAGICEAVIASFDFESVTTKVVKIYRTPKSFVSVEGVRLKRGVSKVKVKEKKYPISTLR